MAEDLTLVYDELKNIRSYLIKIGPSKRCGSILVKKSEELNDNLTSYNSLITQIRDQIKIKAVSSTECALIDKICSEYTKLYKEVQKLCTEKSKMEEFNIKTALSLLPVMTGSELNTKQLIDGIEYYDSVLTKTECKKNLIQFVLKSRLSPYAKLKLSQSYDTVSKLVTDMRVELLPKQAATAIQSRLQTIRQNDMSIKAFGDELSSLFVNLTISQANGKTEAYEVLKPLNENMAIKRFADGLRNRRLSTIIAARNFDSLKDAIQAAEDHEVDSSASQEILRMIPNSAHRGRGTYFRQEYTRGYLNPAGQFRGSRQSYGYRGRSRHYSPGHRGARGARGGTHQGSYGQPKFSGRYNYRRPNGNQWKRNGTVRTMGENDSNANVAGPSSEFFRD